MKSQRISGRLILLFLGLVFTYFSNAQCPVDPSFTFNQYCDSIIFQNTSVITEGGIDSVRWHFGDLNSMVIESPPFDMPFSYIYSGEGEYYVVLEVFNDYSGGCMESVEDTVRIYYPQASFQIDAGCLNELTAFNDMSVSNADSLVGWLWDFGDGNGSSLQNPTHIYTNNANYNVKLKVENNYGCFDSINKNKLIESPVAGFYFDTVCFGSETHFYDTSTYLVNGISEWFWDFGDGYSSTSQNPGFTFGTPGLHTVKLVVTSNTGCTDSVMQDVLVAGLPTAQFSLVVGCKNDTTFLFDESASNADSLVFWEWDFGDGSPFAHSPDTSHIYTDDGMYNIELMVMNNYGCTDDTIRSYLVSTPSAGFMSDSACLGNPVNFTDTSSTNVIPISTYFWDFDDGNTSQAKDTVYQYQTPGLYHVMHVAGNSVGCTDTAYNYVLIDTLPVAAFEYNVSCQGLETCFTDNSQPNSNFITDWYWDFGDGSISTLQHPCHIFNNTGTFVISLFVTNSDGCVSEITYDTLTVSVPPVAGFSSNDICLGDTTFFTNLSDTLSIEVDTWRWTFGDPATGSNDTSFLFEPSHYYAEPGIYDVKLFVRNVMGCPDSITQTVQIDSIPDALFQLPDTVAINKQFVIVDQSASHGSPIINRLWDFGDGQNATNVNPVEHSYEVSGSYYVCLQVEDVNGCIDEYCDSIYISALPEADFQWASDVTLETFFYDDSYPNYSVSNWSWDFGDPTTLQDTASGISNPVYTYPEEGFYEACLHIEDRFGGAHDTCKTVYAGNAVIAEFQFDGSCLNDTTFFLDYSYSPLSSGFENWYWDFGDGTIKTFTEKQDTLKHKYAGPGTYEVKLGLSATINGFFMSDTMYKTIRIFENPVAKIDTSGLGVCYGTPIQFADLTQQNNTYDPVVSWIWDFDNRNDSAYIQNPEHLYADTGSFHVKLLVETEHGCKDLDSVTAHVNFSPKFPFKVINPCINSPALFKPVYDSTKIKITKWFWNFGDNLDTNNTSSEPNPTHVYDRVDLYHVTMSMDAYNCMGDTSLSVLIKPIPYSDFSFVTDFSGIQGRTKFSNNSIYASSYLWDFGNGNTSTVPDPIEVYEHDSVYSVTLISTNEYTCSDTSRYDVRVFFKGLYFPTAFSPNNPNDLIRKFTPKGINLAEYEVQVYDLRGNLVWESDKLDENGTPVESWDGYIDGILMPEGMYVWKAAGVFRDGTVWKGQDFSGSDNPKTNGVVTLIR